MTRPRALNSPALDLGGGRWVDGTSLASKPMLRCGWEVLSSTVAISTARPSCNDTSAQRQVFPSGAARQT